MNEIVQANRICPFCEAMCGLEITTQDQQVVAVKGAKDDVFSHGYICPKGFAIKDLHEDPDRLRQPMIKRNGRFEPASWEEAYQEIENRLLPIIDQYGPHAVGFTIGNPAAHKPSLLLYGRQLMSAVGSHNIFSASTLDQMPKQLSSGLMFGTFLSVAVPDIDRCDYLLMLGANPMASNGSLWTVPDFRGRLKAMQKRGGRLVVIDPRKTETAQLADCHLPIRPGADAYFLLGLAKALKTAQLINLKNLADHTHGLDTFLAALDRFELPELSARCGISVEAIEKIARDLAQSPAGAVYGRIGTCTQSFGTLTSWLVDVINILTGHLDQPGGMMFPKAAAFAANTVGKAGIGRGVIHGRRKSRVRQAPEVMGEFPIAALAEEIEIPGKDQVRALFTFASNPVLSSPNGPRLAKALDNLDFMVSLDIYITETTQYADVILPAPSPLEESHYDVVFPQFAVRNAARYSKPILSKPEGFPSEWQTLLRLKAIVERRGWNIDVRAEDDEVIAKEVAKSVPAPQVEFVLKALSKRQGPDRLADFALRGGPHGDLFGLKPDGLNLDKVAAAENGIDLGALTPRIPEVLRTASGKIELAPEYCLKDLDRLARAISEPVPEMVLTGRRQVRSNNSWMHNLPVLAKGPFRCTAMIHPADAQKYGLKDGGQMILSRAGRSITAVVEINDEMMPGVVSIPHGWGHDQGNANQSLAKQRPGTNLNVLMDENDIDPLSGTSVLTGLPVEIAAA